MQAWEKPVDIRIAAAQARMQDKVTQLKHG
jgi:hypothetical protein